MSVLTEVLKLFKYDPATDGDMTFNIGQCMNDNWDKLDAAILLAIAAAGAYNPEESYAVGDYCTYKGKLRKCSTAIPTGETWTEAHWTTTTVAAELAELSSQLSNLNTLVGGATTPQGALAVLGAGVRPNELDNAYFVGGGTGWGVFPVNQRGASGTISTPGYFIDRWKLVSGTVQITAAGLVLNGTMVQILPASIGSVYTATALTTTGLATCQYDDASRTFAITGTGQTFMFAKLERGAGQTAAYQDADDVWNMLPQPENDYATQLAKCQRHQLELISKNDPQYACVGNGIGRTSGISGIECPIFIPTPITLRTRPVVTFNGNFYLQSGDSSLQVTRMALDRITTNGVNVLVYAENIEIGKFYSLYATISENHSLLLDANL